MALPLLKRIEKICQAARMHAGKEGEKGNFNSVNNEKQSKLSVNKIIMKFTERINLVISLVLITLLWACNGQTRQHSMNQVQESGWVAPFDSVDAQFREIQEAFQRDSMRMSPESRMTFHNMEKLWDEMGAIQQGDMQYTGRENRRRRGRGMMRNRGMMHDSGHMGRGMMGSGMPMMRFHNMNQQMMSYSQGMHQMMQQSGDSSMARMYGQMTARMQQMMSRMPAGNGSAPSVSGTSGTALSGASLYVSNCSGCHGSNGSGIRGAFPPLNGSSIVQGDKETLAKILLHGLQGQVTVKGDTYNGIMPAFGRVLSDEQISAILTYVRSMPDNKSSRLSTEEVRSVREKTVSRQRIWTPDELGLK